MFPGLRTDRHVSETLIWFSLPRKHLHHRALLRPLILRLQMFRIHCNINWRVFKNQWPVPNVKCVWYYEVMSHSWRLQSIGDGLRFLSLSLTVSRAELLTIRSTLCVCGRGRALRLVLAARLRGEYWAGTKESLLFLHIWMWCAASDTTEAISSSHISSPLLSFVSGKGQIMSYLLCDHFCTAMSATVIVTTAGFCKLTWNTQCTEATTVCVNFSADSSSS